MAFLFGRKKKKSKGPNQKKIQKVNLLIQKNNDRILMLTKKEVSLQNRAQKEVERAKDYARKNNRRLAKQCLLRKKQLEQQLDVLMNQKNQVEAVNMKLEQQVTNLEVFNTQKLGTELMGDLTKGMDVEDVHETMDDLRDNMADVDEIGQALGEGVGTVDLDDPDLLDELDDITKEVMDDDLLAMDDVQAPQDPVGVKKAPAKPQEADELDQELGALMADLT